MNSSWIQTLTGGTSRRSNPTGSLPASTTAPAGPGAPTASNNITAPQGWLVEFFSNPGGTLLRWGHTVLTWAQALWEQHPVLVVAVLALGVGIGLALRARRNQMRQQDTQRATWWQIVPPQRLPITGAMPVWRGLRAVLAHYRHGRLALEIHGNGAGSVIAGVWVPPRTPVTQVKAVVTNAWPGARLIRQPAPAWIPQASHPARTVRVVEVTPAEGPWAPLIDPPTPLRMPDSVRVVERPEDEPLGMVLRAIADAPFPVTVQLIVSRSRTQSRRSGPGGVARRGVLRGLDLLTPGATRPPKGATPAGPAIDPVVDARKKREQAKRAAGPHLTTTLRIIASTAWPNTRRDGRDVVDAVVAGFGSAVPGELHARRRRWRPDLSAEQRRPGHRFAATLPELTALWHLPVNSTAYGMTDAAAAERAAPHELTVTPPPPPRSAPPRPTKKPRSTKKQRPRKNPRPAPPSTAHQRNSSRARRADNSHMARSVDHREPDRGVVRRTPRSWKRWSRRRRDAFTGPVVRSVRLDLRDHTDHAAGPRRKDDDA
jgi:hypothetical protein